MDNQSMLYHDGYICLSNQRKVLLLDDEIFVLCELAFWLRMRLVYVIIVDVSLVAKCVEIEDIGFCAYSMI